MFRHKNFFKSTLTEAKKIGAAWSDSKVGTFGAAVAFYTIFSIAPLLVIALAITGFFLDKASTETHILAEFTATFGQSSSDFIKSLIEAHASAGTNIFLTIAGFIVLLAGALGVFNQLQKALDTIFESLKAPQPRKSVWHTIRHKIFSFGLVLSVGFLLLVSLALGVYINSVGDFLSQYISGGVALAHIVEFVVSFTLVSFFLGLMYKALPTKRLKFKPAMIGGFITGVLFTISKYLLGLYLASSAAGTGYGGASALVLFVLWIYYMSQVFFFGAILLRLYIVPRGE